MTEIKLMKGKLPSVHIASLLLSAPQKLRKQVLKENFPCVPRKRETWGLLTYKTQYFGTSIILPSLCQSNRDSLQQTTSQQGWRVKLSSLRADKDRTQKLPGSGGSHFSLHYKLLEKTDGGDDRKSNYFFWVSFLSGF